MVFAFAGISVIATQLGWLKKVHTAVLFAALTGSILYFGINGYMQLQLPRPDTPGPKLAHKSEHPNLIIIMLDTVRAKSLAPYGYNHITTPNIDDFVSKNAVIYTQARSTSSWTLPSHASLFTGRLPSEHNADYPRSGRNTSTVTDILYPAQRLGPELPTLAELLAQRGYQTGAIAANCAYLSYQFGLDRGFEHYDDRAPAMIRPYMSLAQILGFSLETGQLGYRDAETITDTSLAWLAKKRLDAPFFLFVNYLDAHYPYIPPRAFRELFSTDQPRNVLQPHVGIWELQYDRSLRYLDHHVGRLLSYFNEHNMLDKTVIIITSDHGEAFGEHGFNGHGQTLYEEEIKVPLYVTSLNKNQDRTTDVPIVSSDVLYLILKKLGFEQTPAMKNNSIVAELFRSPRKVKMKGNHFDRDLLTWIEGVQKIIVSTKNSVEIYNIESDPEEKKNLATPGAELERISSFAERWWNEHPPPETETVTPVDDALVERLKTLGYLD
jgi:arylsulfatase A-like enzyme